MKLATNEGDRGNAGDTPDLIDTTQLYLSKLQLEANIRAVSGSLYDVRKQIASAGAEKCIFSMVHIHFLYAKNTPEHLMSCTRDS